MAKIVRLTESDLTRLIRRVIMEQDIDVNGITNELKSSLVGRTSQFFESGKDVLQFEIIDITTNFDLSKPRTISIEGLKGMITDYGLTSNSDKVNFYIDYECKTSSSSEKNSPLTYAAKLMPDKSFDSYKFNTTYNGRLTKNLTEYIETNWCKKLPPPIPKADQIDEPNLEKIKKDNRFI